LTRSAPVRWAIFAVAAAVAGTEVRAQTVQSMTTFASGFNFPYALAFDSSGNLYVSNGIGIPITVSKVNSAGTTVAASFASGFNGPYAMAFDTAGNLYVANANTNTVSKVNSAGVTVAASFASGFTQPTGLAFDTAGNLYVSNRTLNTVSKVNSGGTTVAASFASGFGGPRGLAFDTAGNLYVANANTNTVSKVNSAGTTVAASFASGFDTPNGIAFDTAGNLYVANSFGNTVSQVTPGGVVSTFAAGFNSPSGLAFDAAGNLYVANGGTNTVIKLTITGYPAAAVPAAAAPAPTVTVPAPAITSPLTYSSPVNQTFSYSIQASNTPTSYSAANIPAGCFINTYTGGITGTPTIAGTYSVTIGASNAGGTGTANLIVTITPASQTITFPVPASVVANAAPFTLAATSSSGLPITYTVLSGPATVSGNTVTLTGTAGTVTIQASQGGNLAYSAASSATVSFQVTAVPKPVLVNLSARSAVTPASPMIAGFVIAGTTAKTLVLRGVGPSLSSFGLSPVLAHPQLSLLDANGNVLATNTGWGGSATLASAFGSVGAFPLAATSADSAVVATLSPGAYTMKVADAVTDSGGMALGELYDASVDPTGVSQKLINLSSRGQVGTGNSVLVCGFMVSGTTAKTVLIRGVGPSLAPYGLTGLLADPVLNVYDSSGNLVATNNDWGTPVGVNASQTPATASTLTSTAAQVGAFPLIAGSKDAALIVTLPPGAYTAQVSGNGGTTGNGMAEVYEIPQ
jgi:DNA-binding beta-propeller fold protein YncE